MQDILYIFPLKRSFDNSPLNRVRTHRLRTAVRYTLLMRKFRLKTFSKGHVQWFGFAQDLGIQTQIALTPPKEPLARPCNL